VTLEGSMEKNPAKVNARLVVSEVMSSTISSSITAIV
jgi:hypothetical protein